jgi:hypothetical protein
LPIVDSDVPGKAGFVQHIRVDHDSPAPEQYLGWKETCAREDELNLDKYNRAGEEAKGDRGRNRRDPPPRGILLASSANQADPKDGKMEWRATQVQGQTRWRSARPGK